MEDSEDYEILPHKDIEELRREIITLKKNPLLDKDVSKNLAQSIDRLNNSINKLVSILEDAQKDIIEEYQESKPAEKLNQILDQNGKIARALISINDNIQTASSVPIVASSPDQSNQSVSSSQLTPPAPFNPQNQFNQSGYSNPNLSNSTFSNSDNLPKFQEQSMQSFSQNNALPPLTMPSLPDMPNNPKPAKKFLGMI